ncbi:cyclase family protein [Nitriliruptor alkaliphilus]|uniref:cyclase family protein n=1 Tax=Nitriliruptor alkaliphilus TaxID=427918 RepID=UPI00069740F8|nr:cyclase family protein [Nitriliruptor alkaliphilus]
MTLPDGFHELARELRNWGRWGADDERGTLNLLTDEVVRRGVGDVRTGQRLTLAMPLDDQGPQAGLVPGRDNPVHTVTMLHHAFDGDPDHYAASDDAIDMSLQAATHWDALAHVSYGGHLYNGFPAGTVTAKGASRCGIDKVGALVGPGLLLDVARARGVERLTPGHTITPDDLDAAVELARTEVRPGDLLLLRTGQVRSFLDDGDRVAYAYPSAGPGMEAARWFREHDVAAVATDTLVFEVFPCERDGLFLPVHLLDLVEIGLTQGQNFVLEELAVACAEDDRYRFLLDASPQRITGGLGSPVTPVAIR